MSVFQNSKKELFVGTDNDGLYVLDKNFNQINHFTPEGSPNSVANTILSIFEDSNNELWLGSYTKELHGVTLQPDSVNLFQN